MAARFRTQHLHRFDAAGKAFLYLRSAAIFALDDVSRTILELLDTEPRAREEILAVLIADAKQVCQPAVGAGTNTMPLDDTFGPLTMMHTVHCCLRRLLRWRV